MVLMFVVFTTLSILDWQKFNNESKWNPESWDGYFASVIFLICSGWFVLKAYFKGGRLFWIIQFLIAFLTILFDVGFMKEHHSSITFSCYIIQSILWGSALLLCITHGASIFVIRKKLAEPEIRAYGENTR